MTTNNVAIIHLVTRSTPFCRPMLQMTKPMAMAASIHPTSSPGLASMALNICPVAAASAAPNVPEAILGM